LPGKGWFWYIPLANDIVSVGIVAEKDYLYKDTHDLAAIFQEKSKRTPGSGSTLPPASSSDLIA
jgi:flavin-dependent dehydrogenase